LGGDEFLVIVRAARASEIATQTVEDIVQALAMAISVAGRSHVMRASLGVAVLAQGDTADDLVRKADEAMYEAKECGRASAATTWRAYDRPVIRGVDTAGDDISGIRDVPAGKMRHLRQPHCADGEGAMLRSNP
jgi:predicted signal transduction protein with EAL and GGDEF domain